MKINKTEMIASRLQQAFSPLHLQVLDESEQHHGHAGYQGGGRHFAIVIKAACFDGMTRVAAHREIYAVLSDLMPAEIHAIRIEVLSCKRNINIF